MALKVGDLYVAVTASIGEAVANLGKLVKHAEKVAKNVKEATEPIGKIGAVVAAGIAAAVAASAESNAAMKEQTERIKALLVTLAAELGDLFAPLVKKVAHVIEQVVAKLQSMSPESKRAAASMAAWVAGLGLGIGAVGKLAGTMEGLFKGFGIFLEMSRSVLPVFTHLGVGAGKALQSLQTLAQVDIGKALAGMKSGVGGLGSAVADFTTSVPSLLGSVGRIAVSFATAAIPILAVVAALAGIALLVGSVYKSWGDIKYLAKDAWGAMSQSVSEMMAGISDVAMKLANIFGLAFSALSATVESMVDRSLDFVAFLVAKSASVLRPIARAVGMGNADKALASAETLTGKGLKKGIMEALAAGGNAFVEKAAKATAELNRGAVLIATKAADGAKAAASAAKDTVGFGLEHSLSGIQDIVAAVLNSKTVEEWKGKMGELKALLDSLFSGDAKAALRTGAGDENGIEVSAAGHKGMERFAERLRGGLASPAMEAYAKVMEDNAKALAESIRKAAEEAAAAAAAAKADLLYGFLGRLGEISGIIDSAKKGFEAGGWWGALLAAIGELVMGSDEMAAAIDVLNGIIKMLKDMFGAAATGLDTVMGAVGYLVSVVVEVVQPTMEAMGEAMEGIAPIIVLVGMVLKMLAPAFQAIGKATAWLLDNVLKGLFQVLRYVAIAILYVIKGLGSAWNGIVSAIQWVFKKLGDISIFGAHPLGFLKGWANSMESAKVDTESLARSIQELEGLTWDAAMAKARETAEVLKNRDALEDVNEALSNVPDLWKVALRRFDSQDEQDGPNTAPGTQPSPSPSTPPTPPPEVLPPVSRDGGAPFVVGGPMQQVLDRIFGGANAAGTANAAAMPPVQYNITGFDLSDAMAQARQDYEDRQRKAGLRLYGTTAAVAGRYT
ncbi:MULTISPECIES: hypothetical protein [unclassified Corallococcus]|uniref:hypothetical protein n=1 Tax=unclassified Corallococcus TaxID=2685029 RepID=UPI001A8D53DE|nr:MULTISPECIES: hypothetical protein [unclassified Corallococcus]MBN9687119.1 hypothetical protein [Corallococcus sp. NCSPR001]WAS89053.1 hypothetical protein O0N60_19225 [Corallococcus sp. NCRR]